MKRRFLLVVALVASAAANATSVTLTFTPPRDATATIELRQLARVADYEKPPTVTQHVLLSGPVSIDVPEGHWALTVISLDVWHHAQTFSVYSAPVTLEVPLRRAGIVGGSLQSAQNGELPNEVRVAFDDHDGVAICPVVDGTFQCRLPAGTLDLRLRAPGCVTRFFWQETVTPDLPLDLGTVSLVRGATLIGHVEIERGAKVALPVQVRAKGAAESLAATVERDGVFHLDGIAPGKYEVSASAEPRLRSQTVSVEVKPFSAAEMKDPLRVQRPKALHAFIVPPFDPHNQPWRIELAHRLSNASITGEWTAPELSAGKYEFRVLSSDQSVWHRQSVEIGAADVALNILLAPRILHGTVTRDGKPVSAHVELSDEVATIGFDSDEGGRFTGAVPLVSAEWTAALTADAPPIRCKLEHVRPSRRDESNDVDLAIQLPNTGLSGTVVDEEGNPERAIVNVSGASGLQQIHAAEDGSFFVSGLPAGKYGVQASAFLKESDPYDVELSEGGVGDALKLVVHDVEKVHGRVISDFGPVAGATVLVTPTDVGARMVEVNVTNETGEFSTHVPHGVREVDIFVTAPGYALKFFHSPMHQGLLTIPVGQSGGSIRVPKRAGGTTPYLLHIGAIESLSGMLWTSAVVDDGNDYILPAVDAGAYSLCYLSNDEASVARGALTLPQSRCQSAFLAPFGTLSFSP